MRLPPPAILNPADDLHHYSYDQIMALVKAGKVDLYAKRTPPAQLVKAWIKSNDSLLSPSPSQVKELTLSIFSHRPSQAAYEREEKKVFAMFEKKRMERYLKAEEQQRALRNEDTVEYALGVALRLVHAAAGKIEGITSPLKAEHYKLLLDDPRVKLSSLGTPKVLLERIFANRAHILRILNIPQNLVERVPTAGEVANDPDDDPLMCAVCNGDGSEDRPILKCDGLHDVEVGYHLGCLPEGHKLDDIPAENVDWLCPQCTSRDFYVVREVLAKETRQLRGAPKGRRVVHYKLSWKGYGADHDSWEPLEHIPVSGREKINAFNLRARQAAAEEARHASRGGAGSSSGAASSSDAVSSSSAPAEELKRPRRK